MANVVPDPSLDTRNADQLAAQAIGAFPSQLSDRSDSNPAVALAEAFFSVADKVLFQINNWPRALIQKVLAICGITLRPATPASCTQQFTLSAPQRADSVIASGTQVSATDGTIVFETLSDLTISAYTTTAGTVAITTGSATVTGSGTTFVTGSTWEGYQIQIPANTGAWYTISSVASTTSLTLSAVVAITASTQAWNVGPVSGTTTVQSTETGDDQNVGAGKLTTLVSSPAGVASTTNTTAASGGDDEETALEAIARGPTEYAARDVACSAEDFEKFTTDVLGANSRAKARGGYNDTTVASGYMSVAMLSPAWTTSSSVSTAERAEAVRDLAGRYQTGVTLVDLAATVTSLTAAGSIPTCVVYRKPTHDENSVRINIARALNTHFSPNTYEWGRERYLADMIQVIESADGVDRLHTISGRPCVGSDYFTAANNMSFTAGGTSVSCNGADSASMINGQSMIIDTVTKAAHLVTAGATTTTLTITPAWGGSTGSFAAVPIFTAKDSSGTTWRTVYYANLGTTSANLPASIVVTGSAT